MLRTILASILLALTFAVSGHEDWNQCYYDKNAVGPPDLLPCQNETDVGPNDHAPCCFAGDSCLDKSSCWDPTTGNTYQYGCNDETYSHPSCPVKGNLDRGKSPWVGLVLCDNKDRDIADQVWVCNHPDTCGTHCPIDPKNPEETLSVWPFEMINLPGLGDGRCSELARQIVATYAPTSIPGKGSVPTVATDVASKPQATRVPTKDSDGGSSLSKGAIAGIAVGAALGVIAILAGVFCMWRRRRGKAQAQAQAPAPAPPHDPQSSPAPQYHSPGFPSSPAPYPGYDKQNIVYPNSPSTFSDGTGIQRPVSDMSMSTVSPTPMGSPRPHPSQYYQQGNHPAPGPYGYGSHAELSQDARMVYEMPEIREKPDRSELP